MKSILGLIVGLEGITNLGYIFDSSVNLNHHLIFYNKLKRRVTEHGRVRAMYLGFDEQDEDLNGVLMNMILSNMHLYFSLPFNDLLR